VDSTPGLDAGVANRIKKEWQDEHGRNRKQAAIGVASLRNTKGAMRDADWIRSIRKLSGPGKVAMARSRRDSSKPRVATPLVDLFVSRMGTADRSPWRTMEDLVECLRRDARLASALSLDRYLEFRNVVERRADPNIGCDGYIEPIGATFADGFRLVLNDTTLQFGSASLWRMRSAIRFSMRLFRTEIHAAPYDSFEEALCNHGAAALLMPAEDVLAHVSVRDVSLATLEELSQRYAVSIEAAFLRVRGLRLWNCEMTVWHRMVSGDFVVDRLHGWLKADWRWSMFNPKSGLVSEGELSSFRTFLCLLRKTI